MKSFALGDWVRCGWMAVLFISLMALVQTPFGADDAKRKPAMECIGSLGEAITSFAVEGHILYVGGGYTLRSVDISDPAKPKELGWLRMDGLISDIVARGSDVYVTVAQTERHLTHVDASKPDALRMIDQLGEGDKSHGEKIKDLSTSGTLKSILTIKTESVGVPGLNGPVIKAGEQRAIGKIDHDLGIFDTSNSRHWMVLGRYRQRIEMDSVKVADRLAYAVGNQGVSVIDCRKPERPALIGSCDLPTSVNVCAVEDEIFFAAGNTGRLYAVNIAKPAAPDLLGSMQLDVPPLSMAVSGKRMFLATGPEGLWMIDTTQPGAMKRAGEYKTPEPCLDLVTSGTLVFTLTPKSVYVLDATNTRTLTIKGNLVHKTVGGDAFDFHTEKYVLKRLGQYLYIVHIQFEDERGRTLSQVKIVDASDPKAPKLMEGGISPDDASSNPVTATRNRTVAKPEAKSKTAGWILGMPGRSLTSGGKEPSLSIYDLSDPLHPEYIDEYSGVLTSNQAVLFKNTIYKADGVGGMLILRRGGGRDESRP